MRGPGNMANGPVIFIGATGCATLRTALPIYNVAEFQSGQYKSSMFKRLVRLPALLLGLLGCTPAPDFTLLDGSEHRLADYRGRWLLVNYWAEWCEPCRQELPELARFAARYADAVSVLAVNFDQPPNAELRAQVARLQVAIPVLASEPPPRLPFGQPSGLPATWLVAPDGSVHGPLLGPQTEATLLVALREIEPAF